MRRVVAVVLSAVVPPALALSVAVVLADDSLAQVAPSSPVKVETPWLRATPNGASVIGGYATIVNSGTTPDRLVGASIPMAATAEVHAMSMLNGIMHMERLADGLVVPPGATVSLTPGGNHLMFLRPTRQIRQGETIQGTLQFERAGSVPVTFTVAAIGAKSAAGGHAPAMHAMPDMKM